MRNLEKALDDIIAFAKEDDNIRALVLQGSYVNDQVVTDDFTDLDPLFYVRDLTPFTKTDAWKTRFGRPISGFADEDELHDGHKWYTRLTLFDDGFKIDFGFQSVEMAAYANEMPLYRILLDKDGIVPKPDVDDDRKFYVRKPTEAMFLDRLNAFFYDSSYVVKALARQEIFFAQYMMGVLKEKIRLLLDWYIGILHDFQVNPGVMGRYYRRYLDEEMWQMLMKTYADAGRWRTAQALIASYDLVGLVGRKIAKTLGFDYPKQEEKDMRAYCEHVIETYL